MLHLPFSIVPHLRDSSIRSSLFQILLSCLQAAALINYPPFLSFLPPLIALALSPASLALPCPVPQPFVAVHCLPCHLRRSRIVVFQTLSPSLFCRTLLFLILDLFFPNPFPAPCSSPSPASTGIAEKFRRDRGSGGGAMKSEAHKHPRDKGLAGRGRDPLNC